MAIIYTYPAVTDLDINDQIVISQANNKNATRNTTLGALATWLGGGTVFADKAWQKMTFSSNGVPASLFPEVVADEVDSTLNFTSAGGSITFTTTYDAVTKQYTVNMEDQGLDGNIASRDLWFDGDWTTNLWNNVTETLHTWALGTRLPEDSTNSLEWDTVAKFDSGQIQFGTNPVPAGLPSNNSSWFIPINNNNQGLRNVHVGGAKGGTIVSNHKFDTDSVSLGLNALINSGLINYEGVILSLDTSGLPDGTGYLADSAGPTLVTTTSGSGEGLEIEWTVDGSPMGRVNTVTIVSGGSNYNAGETITVPGGNEDCVLGIVSVSNVENNNESVAIGNDALKIFGSSTVFPTTFNYQYGQNVAVGYSSLTSNTGVALDGLGNEYSGSFNVAVGGRSLEDLDGGETNTAIGHNAAWVAEFASGNVAIGFEVADGGSPSSAVPSAGLINGFNNVLVGQHADVSDAIESIAIGQGAQLIQTPTTFPDQGVLIGADSSAYGVGNVSIGAKTKVLGPAASPFDPEDGRYITIGESIEFFPNTFGAGQCYTTVVGNKGVSYGSFNDQLGNYTIIGDNAFQENFDNVVIGGGSALAGGRNVSIGTDGRIGFNATYWPNPPVYSGVPILDSIGLGHKHTITTDATFQVAFDNGGTPNPSIELVSPTNGGGLPNQIQVDKDLTITGFNNPSTDPAVDPSTCLFEFERTQFFGQTIASQNTYVNVGDLDTIAPNMDLGDIVSIFVDGTLIGPASFTLSFPTNIAPGTYIMTISHPQSAAWTLNFGPGNWKWPGGVVPTLTPVGAPGQVVDVLTFVCDGSNLYGVMQNGFQ